MGLSFTQILFTVVVVVAVWRLIGMVERRRRLNASARHEDRAVEVVRCPHCGTYAPRGGGCPHCGRRG